MKKNRLKIKQGDKVRVISGNYKGKESIVEKALPKKRQVVVAEVNTARKHFRPRSQEQPGGIVEVTQPIDVSNVMLVCPACNKPTRIGYTTQGDEKMRVCKKCGSIIK